MLKPKGGTDLLHSVSSGRAPTSRFTVGRVALTPRCLRLRNFALDAVAGPHSVPLQLDENSRPAA